MTTAPILAALAAAEPVLLNTLNKDGYSVDIAIEEMAELIVALMHRQCGRCSNSAVNEEIADVLITVMKLAICGPADEVAAEIARKVARLDERMR